MIHSTLYHTTWHAMYFFRLIITWSKCLSWRGHIGDYSAWVNSAGLVIHGRRGSYCESIVQTKPKKDEAAVGWFWSSDNILSREFESLKKTITLLQGPSLLLRRGIFTQVRGLIYLIFKRFEINFEFSSHSLFLLIKQTRPNIQWLLSKRPRTWCHIM